MTDMVGLRRDKASGLMAAGQLEAALWEYQKVIEDVPEDLSSRRKVAELLQRLGRQKDALSTYETLAEAWARRGWLLRAVALCKIILQIEPQHERTQRLLTELYARRPSPRSLPTPPPIAGPVGAVAAEPKPGLGKGPRFPVFSQLDGEAFRSLLEELEMRLFQPGETILEEGKASISMFAIVEGSVEVVRKQEQGGERPVALMGEGTLFGEMALASDGLRLSSIRAYEPTVVLELTRSRVEQLVLKHPSVGQVLQTFHRERMLTQMMDKSALFSALTQPQRDAVALEFQLCSMPTDRPLIEQGQTVDALYLLMRGRCRVTHQRAEGGEIAFLQEGDLFGEIALLLGTPATATVVTNSSCTLLRLSRDACERHLLHHPGLREHLSRMAAERLQRTARMISGETPGGQDDVASEPESAGTTPPLG